MTKLGILLTSSPQSADGRTVRQLTRAALARGHGVEIFVMEDGVYHLLDGQFTALAKEGARVAACAQACTQRGVPRVDGVHYGSQYDLAILVEEADRFLHFG